MFLSDIAKFPAKADLLKPSVEGKDSFLNKKLNSSRLNRGNFYAHSKQQALYSRRDVFRSHNTGRNKMSTDDNEVDMVKIGNLTQYSRKVYTVAKVISKTEEREVTSRSDMSTHRVAEALVADETGSVYLTLWDDVLDQVEDDQILNIKDAYVNLFRGSMRLNLGRYGSYELLDEAPFEDVDLDNNLSSKVFERQPRGYDRGRGRGYGQGSRRRY